MTNSTTVVLVHGALTDASVWQDVIPELQRAGHPVLAPALPLRSLAADADYLHRFLDTIETNVLLVGHSYAGSVLSDPAAATPAVRGLVFVAAFQPDADESTGELNYRFPGSGLTPDTSLVRETPDGSELYLRPEAFGQVYAGDLARAVVATMAAAQRPINPDALGETFTAPPTWRSLPSWTLIATEDGSLPTEAQRFMANRAGSTVREVPSSHAVPRSHPAETARLIIDALA